MHVAKGDILELLVTYVSGDACWGTAGELTGFVHHTGWSTERPIPASAVPIEGHKLTVKVIHVVRDGEQLPAWSTFGGKFKIDFAAAVPAVAGIDAIVRLVGSGLRQRQTEQEIIAARVSTGVETGVAPKLFADLKVAIQHGVQSVVVGVDDPPEDAVLLAAYRYGRSAFRGTLWSVWLRRLIPLALLVGIILLVVWFAFRGR